MVQNKLVDFLAAYGPTSDGNNMYDEFVVAAAEKASVDPIAIPETRSDEILKDLTAEQPRSVILTGTAGDGKTYTARKVLEALSGNAETWANTQETYEWVDSKSERSIVFVKDLSELETQSKGEIIARMVAAFSDPASTEHFVLCVNDGHLLRTWEEHIKGDSQGERILATFSAALEGRSGHTA